MTISPIIKDNIRVSIIVPIYGVERYIEKCAHSLFKQSYTNIEYVFVNDCTKDNSMDILSKCIDCYPNLIPNIKIINLDKNVGLAGARKIGILESTGEYIFHIDSDDWLVLDAIENCIEIVRNNHPDMVVGDFFITYDKKEFVQKVEIAPKEEYIINILERNRKFLWTLCNRLIRREIQMKALPLEGINMGEDFATVPRLLYYSNTISKLDLPIYHYRQTNTNSYTKRLSKSSIFSLLKAFDNLEQFFSKTQDFQKYTTALQRGKVKLKYDMCISSGKETFSLLSEIWPEITHKEASGLMEKLILFLVDKRKYQMMVFISKSGLKIKKIIRLIFSKK